MNTGKVKFFIEEKGFGFIIDDETGQDYYVHASGLVDKVAAEDKVTFTLEEGPRGFKAVDVRIASDPE